MPNSTILSELSTAITCCARCANNNEKAPSPRAQVGDHQRRKQLQQGLGNALPGAPGNVLPSQPAGHIVEKCPRFVLPLTQNQRKGSLVLPGLGNLFCRLTQRPEEGQNTGFLLEAVPNIFAGPPALHQAGVFEKSQMGRDGALPHVQDLLQLSDRELLLGQKQQNAQAIGIA